jgi:hypothetical protein
VKKCKIKICSFSREFRDGFGPLYGSLFGTILVVFGVLLRLCFRSLFSERLRAKKGLMLTPPGGRKSRSRLHAVRYFRKSGVSEGRAPGGGSEVVFGTLFGVLFEALWRFLAHSKKSHFGHRKGTCQNCFFLGSVACWRRLTQSVCWLQHSTPSALLAKTSILPRRNACFREGLKNPLRGRGVNCIYSRPPS